MDRNQIERPELVNTLSDFDTVACRMCLEKNGGEWHVTQMVGDLNRPDSVEPLADLYPYTNVAFIREMVSVEEFCSWITGLKGTVRELSFHLPEPKSRIQRERYPTGLAMNHFYRLPYPFTLYTMSSTRDDRQRDPFKPLVKTGLPSFPNFETAYYRFLFDRAYGPGEAIPRDLLVVRVAHPEAWISSVEAESNAITVVLEGDRCDGTQLTVGGSDGVIVNEGVNRNGAHRFEPKDTKLDNLWMVLSRDDVWVDWRDNRGTGPRTSWQISGVQPSNLAANIDHLLSQGEDDQLEYKSRVPEREDKVLKTVAAFANGSGGIILVGVADDGSVESINEDVSRFMDAIVNKIRNRIIPAPICDLGKCVVDNKTVAAVFVREGDEPPYGLNDKPPSIYVRRHGTTFDATPGEIRALGAKNQPVASYPRPYEF